MHVPSAVRTGWNTPPIPPTPLPRWWIRCRKCRVCLIWRWVSRPRSTAMNFYERRAAPGRRQIYLAALPFPLRSVRNIRQPLSSSIFVCWALVSVVWSKGASLFSCFYWNAPFFLSQQREKFLHLNTPPPKNNRLTYMVHNYHQVWLRAKKAIIPHVSALEIDRPPWLKQHFCLVKGKGVNKYNKSPCWLFPLLHSRSCLQAPRPSSCASWFFFPDANKAPSAPFCLCAFLSSIRAARRVKKKHRFSGSCFPLQSPLFQSALRTEAFVLSHLADSCWSKSSGREKNNTFSGGTWYYIKGGEIEGRKKSCHSGVWTKNYRQQVSPNEAEVKRMIIPASEAGWVVLSSRIPAIRHAKVCFRCQEPTPEMTLWPCKGIMKVMMRWKVALAQKWSVQGFSCCQTWQLLR